MYHLIIGALQKGGVDRAEWAHALRRQPRSEGNGMLLGNAHVKAAGGVRMRELVHPGAAGHGGGDGDNALVGLGQLGQRLAKHVLIAGRPGRGLHLLAGDDVELLHPVILVGGSLGGGIALALLRDDMDQAGAGGGIAHILQHRDQLLQIMPVDGPDIVEAQLLEQGAAHRHATGKLVRFARRAVQAGGQMRRQPLGQLAHLQKGAARYQPREISRQPANRRRDRHVVVIQNDHQPVARVMGVVHRLIGHAGRHRAIADDGNALARPARQLVGHGKAQRRRDRRAGMRRAEGVVLALAALGEARQTTRLTNRAQCLAPASQDLVRIGLMANVPDQTVHRRVEHIMQRHRQLDYAQPGAQMPTRLANRLQHVRANLVRQLAQLRQR